MESDEFCIEPLPKKRKGRARKASLVIFVLTISIVITLCILNKTGVEYQMDETTTHNQTLSCYRRKEKVLFPSLHNTFLIFVGVILGTLVERLSLIAEERHHINSRYGGRRAVMFKACFRGISWGSVLTLLCLTFTALLGYYLSTGSPINFTVNFVYIFSGIGVGPFIISILKLNTQSEVYVSTVMEEKGSNIVSGLAWYYYFNYLNDALSAFTKLTSSNSGLSVKLSENKLILLLSYDCFFEQKLEQKDPNFRKAGEIKHDNFTFPVYQLKVNEKKYKQYAVYFVNGPSQILNKIRLGIFSGSTSTKQYEDEVKLLCRTIFEITRTKLNKALRDKCVLIAFKVGSYGRFDNGALARLVVHAIENTTMQTDGTSENQDYGFWKFSSNHATAI